ncbi:MAG: ribosome maturation factor RimM [Candidatus Gastranaerophilales bacterium]|nr:ribosome maturation factor RimM [Candidatus Gastranaerophilales bacterium]
MEYISIGKILNFHGIKGEAKIGFSNQALIASVKEVYAGLSKTKFKVSYVRFHKNFAIVKFEEINSINELIEYKGENIYLLKETVEKNLDKNEFLIDDLIGINVFDNEENFIGHVEEIQKSKANDILCIKSDTKENLILVPFVSELVPIVDIKAKKIIIKPIEGLL